MKAKAYQRRRIGESGVINIGLAKAWRRKR